jgi:protein TonB
MESTTAVDSPVSAAVGGSRFGSPSGSGHGPGGAVGGSGPGEGPGGGASELQVASMPEVDTDACGRTVTYPPDAERAGIEGSVRLRVALDARGRVRNAHVLSGLGHGLDQAAVEAIQHRCKFTPAIARNGQAVAFVIQSYTFRFELPR